MIHFIRNHFVALIYLTYSLFVLWMYKKIIGKDDYKKGLKIIMIYNSFLFFVSFLSFYVIKKTYPELDYSFIPLVWISISTVFILYVFKQLARRYQRFRNTMLFYIIAITPVLVVLMGMFLWEFYIFPRI